MGRPDQLGQPANKMYAVALSDATADPNGPFSKIYVGGAGNVKVTTRGRTDVTLNGMLAGMFYDIRVQRVWSTGTTATNILGVKED